MNNHFDNAPTSAVIAIMLHDDGVMETYCRAPMTGQEFADLLMQIAAKYATGDILDLTEFNTTDEPSETQ